MNNNLTIGTNTMTKNKIETTMTKNLKDYFWSFYGKNVGIYKNFFNNNLTIKELDKAIKEDPAHEFKNAKEALMAAVEGKLPIVKADGTLKPIEKTFTVIFDPTTGSVEIK